MGKYLGVIIGVIIVLLGVRGLLFWWPDFLTVLKGAIPAMFIIAGAIAVIAGLSEIRDELSSKEKEEKK
ncbi:MAG: hypothetical protein Q8R38_01445 [Candidatus Omnitrophota bacterium]|nr:hypothetical protein [Candidatus Omnitrophota bacterium]